MGRILLLLIQALYLPCSQRQGCWGALEHTRMRAEHWLVGSIYTLDQARQGVCKEDPCDGAERAVCQTHALRPIHPAQEDFLPGREEGDGKCLPICGAFLGIFRVGTGHLSPENTPNLAGDAQQDCPGPPVSVPPPPGFPASGWPSLTANEGQSRDY